MVRIIGDIGPNEGEVSLLDVVEQIQRETGDTIHVLIDSNGGYLDIGISIHDYLSGLEKTVVTECVNNCASAATIPFLAGNVRIAGCPLMIHSPFIPPESGLSGTASDIQSYADLLKGKETELEKLYAKKTGLDAETLSMLMEYDTYISPSQAVALGFATEAKQIAYAKLNNPNNKKNENEMSDAKESLRAKLLARIGFKPTVKNKDYTTANGETLTVDREDGSPQVGDAARPDGSHTMEDGTVIIVENEIIVSITQPQNQSEETPDAEVEEIAGVMEEIVEELIQEIETLKEEVAMAKAAALSPEDKKILDMVKNAGGASKVFAQIKSTYKPVSRVGLQNKSVKEEQGGGRIQEKLEALRTKVNNKSRI